ncbi:hypothetical protein GW17_00013496 [Ensete ventricosum]|nr:hypothetical protein GW17_00013496 [Ensete ventricosum]
MAASCSFHHHLQTLPTWLLLAAAVGGLALLRLSFAALRWTFVTFLRPGKDLRRYGSWAVVTGSTDGIGRAFALQLARRGLNLVLVGRNPDKLRDVADAVRGARDPPIRVETVVVDLAGDLVDGVARLRTAIQGLDVGILVNNAGVSYPYARFFHEVDEELMRNLIKVNVEGVTTMTQAVLPGMLERKRGAIVNIGSGAAIVIPSDPLYAVYAATKAGKIRTARYIPVRQLTGTRTGRYRAPSPPALPASRRRPRCPSAVTARVAHAALSPSPPALP